MALAPSEKAWLRLPNTVEYFFANCFKYPLKLVLRKLDPYH